MRFKIGCQNTSPFVKLVARGIWRDCPNTSRYDLGEELGGKGDEGRNAGGKDDEEQAYNDLIGGFRIVFLPISDNGPTRSHVH